MTLQTLLSVRVNLFFSEEAPGIATSQTAVTIGKLHHQFWQVFRMAEATQRLILNFPFPPSPLMSSKISEFISENHTIHFYNP